MALVGNRPGDTLKFFGVLLAQKSNFRDGMDPHAGKVLRDLSHHLRVGKSAQVPNGPFRDPILLVSTEPHTPTAKLLSMDPSPITLDGVGTAGWVAQDIPQCLHMWTSPKAGLLPVSPIVSPI